MSGLITRSRLMINHIFFKYHEFRTLTWNIWGYILTISKEYASGIGAIGVGTSISWRSIGTTMYHFLSIFSSAAVYLT